MWLQCGELGPWLPWCQSLPDAWAQEEPAFSAICWEFDDALGQRLDAHEPIALYTHNAALVAAASSDAWWARSLVGPPTA